MLSWMSKNYLETENYLAINVKMVKAAKKAISFNWTDYFSFIASPIFILLSTA